MMQDLALDLLNVSFIYQIGDHLKNFHLGVKLEKKKIEKVAYKILKRCIHALVFCLFFSQEFHCILWWTTQSELK